LGEAGEETFADRLQAALASRGLAGTVWRPALDAGFDYEAFAWSGENHHRARMAGAKRLAAALDGLAGALEATPEEPLRVNLVSHSHGGNVVLEALGRLSDRVRPNRVVLLGTPLIARRGALRLVRLLLGLVLLGLVASLFLVAALGFAGLPVAGGYHPAALLGIVLLLAVSYGWVFMLVGNLVDAVWRAVDYLARVTIGRGAGQVYGPPPARLAALLDGEPVVLLTSHHDEADLVLQLGSAPRRLYREWVEGAWGLPGRLFERVVLRPFVDGVVLKLLAVALERFVLGFSWPAVLFGDYEMADLDRGKAYPKSVLVRLDVTEDLVPVLRNKQASQRAWTALPVVEETPELSGPGRRSETLRETLREVLRGLKAQIRLRHSAYYESDAVLERLADVLSSSSAAWAAASRAIGTRNGEHET
jgi:hypothetical protein